MHQKRMNNRSVFRTAVLCFAALLAALLLFQLCVPTLDRGSSAPSGAFVGQRFKLAEKARPSLQRDSDGPSKDDLTGCSSKLAYPSSGSWLDDYETRYVESSGGKGIYLCYERGEKSFATLEDNTEVTVLARTERNSLVITEDGEIGWCLSGYLTTKYPSVYDVLEYDYPTRDALDGCTDKLQQPKKSQMLDEYDIRYVESSSGKGIYLCRKPGEESFSTLPDDTQVAVMARTEKNSFVITERGEIGWCRSASLVTTEPDRSSYSGSPSRSDLSGASSKLQYPNADQWLDKYEYRYVESSAGGGIYLCYKPGKDSFATIEDGTEVTVLARTPKNSLVITENGEIGWCLSSRLTK